MGCKLEPLAPVLLILPYRLEFKTFWHLLCMGEGQRHLQILLEVSWYLNGTGLACAMQESITSRHEETELEQ